jgi:hypothetical protein
LPAPITNYNSPGLVPNGVSGSPLDGLLVKGSYFQLVLGTPPAQKLQAVEWAKSLWRPFGAPRLDFRRFLIDLWPIKKTWFFGIAPKRQRKQIQSIHARPMSAKGSKKSTFGFPFCIDFPTFS